MVRKKIVYKNVTKTYIEVIYNDDTNYKFEMPKDKAEDALYELSLNTPNDFAVIYRACIRKSLIKSAKYIEQEYLQQVEADIEVDKE